MNDAAEIHRLIVEVLCVPPASVHPESDLVFELGAESIDFLDLIFSLDPLVGTRVLPEHWGAWLKERLGQNDGSGITPRLIEEFVVFYRAAASPQPLAGDAS